MQFWFRNLAISVLLLGPIPFSFATQEIVFWHSMAGQLGEEVNQLAKQFNQQQTQYQVKPIYKGNYIESLSSFAAAFRAKQPPNMIQVFEVGTSVMLSPPGIIKPVEQLMHEQGVDVEKAFLMPAIRYQYSDRNQLMAMPFNVSIPVLFYNVDVLNKLGISSSNFPKTWTELETLLQALQQSGYACGYTTAYPAWILIESYAALNGLSPYDVESAQMMTTHIHRMSQWQKQHYFEYGGRVDDATVLFTSGKCPLFSQSSGAYSALSQLVSFHLGVAPLPLDHHISTKRHNNVVGGAAIWVIAGQTPEIERGIAQFLSFLSQPQQQKQWYQQTGYIPLNPLSADALKSNMILKLAISDLSHPIEREALQPGMPLNQIRTIYDEMLESIFSGITSPKEAIKKAQKRAQHVITRFKKNVQKA